MNENGIDELRNLIDVTKDTKIIGYRTKEYCSNNNEISLKDIQYYYIEDLSIELIVKMTYALEYSHKVSLTKHSISYY